MSRGKPTPSWLSCRDPNASPQGREETRLAGRWLGQLLAASNNSWSGSPSFRFPPLERSPYWTQTSKGRASGPGRSHRGGKPCSQRGSWGVPRTQCLASVWVGWGARVRLSPRCDIGDSEDLSLLFLWGLHREPTQGTWPGNSSPGLPRAWRVSPSWLSMSHQVK